MLNIIRLPECASTSSELRAMQPPARHGTVVVTDCQTAGRGQRGNHWEAEPGKNLTFSIMLEPAGLQARDQFTLSEAVAIAVVDTLRPLVPDPEDIRVKWPNDIYWRDLKLVGILIENSLAGPCISRSVAGIGVNVNQERFLSDAPNPVSLKMITGRDYDLDRLIDNLSTAIINIVDNLNKGGESGCEENSVTHAALHERYRQMLWRGTGYHPYRDAATGEQFQAAIQSIAPDGLLTLALQGDPVPRTYAFKEVHPIL